MITKNNLKDILDRIEIINDNPTLGYGHIDNVIQEIRKEFAILGDVEKWYI